MVGNRPFEIAKVFFLQTHKDKSRPKLWNTEIRCIEHLPLWLGIRVDAVFWKSLVR